MSDFPELPPIATAPLSVVLLAPSEAKVEETVLAWSAQLAGRGPEDEILLVPASPDRNPERDEALAGRHARLRWVLPPTRPGLGAALRAGLEAARHPLLFYTTGDGQYSPAELNLLLKWIDKVDLVSGYRVWPAGFDRRRWKERAYRWLVRAFFGVRLRDVNCWYVLARRSLFARIPIQSDGLFAQAEVLAKANFLGKIMTEVPVAYRPLPLEEPAGSSFLAEAYRVFFQPDFGPARLPPEGGSSPAMGTEGFGPPTPRV